MEYWAYIIKQVRDGKIMEEQPPETQVIQEQHAQTQACLLYTSDAADE